MITPESVDLSTWPSEMNKTEERFWLEYLRPRYISGELLWAAFEPMALRLGRRLIYWPDFLSVTRKGELHGYEVKATWGGTRKHPAQRAGWQEDSRVKIKAAATRYPWVRFFGCHQVGPRRKGVIRDWKLEEIRPEKLPPSHNTGPGAEPE